MNVNVDRPVVVSIRGSAMPFGVGQLPSAAGQFGFDVLGPVVGEFCLRLWWTSQLIDEPGQTTLLFCARGGLRMQLAYERFLTATGLPNAAAIAPLMVSRLIAMRGAVLRAVREGRSDLLPAAAAALDYEFANTSVRDVAQQLAGIEISASARGWDEPQSPAALVRLLRHADGAGVRTELERQEALFTEHLANSRGDRGRVVLVDTGFYGTTRELLAEGHPDLDWGSVLLARSFRPRYPTRGSRTVGLLVEAAAYIPFHRRTSLLRYWHYIESLFEPDLISVSTFRRTEDGVQSNLEVPGWPQRVLPDPGSAFEGVLRYLDALPPSPAGRIAADVGPAWTHLHKAIVWPNRDQGDVLAVSRRTHDFGRGDAWTAQPWRGPLHALRTSTMWREGTIARSGTRWRWPLLSVIELGYGARLVIRKVRARSPRAR